MVLGTFEKLQAEFFPKAVRGSLSAPGIII